MRMSALIYAPSDTPEAMSLATKKVAGVPLIVRSIATLAEAGIERVALLVAESQKARIAAFIDRYRGKGMPAVEMISYDEPYRVSPDIVRTIGEGAAGRMLVINANLIFDKGLIAAIRGAALKAGAVMLCEEGVHPLPVMDVTPDAWATIEEFAGTEARSIESCLGHLRGLAQPEMAKIPTGSDTFLLRTTRDRAVAEKSLAESIRHRTPGPIAKLINKRISLPVSLFLSKLWISPNSITGFNIVIGLFAGVFVADGHSYEMILLGAVLFQTASIVDGCDGEVARLTFRCTKFGQYADTLSDNLSLGSMLGGIMAGYWRATHSPVAFYVGAIMLASTALTIFLIVRFLRRETDSASLATFNKAYLQKLTGQPRWLMAFIKYGKYALWKDVYSLIFLIAAVLGVLYWLLFIVAFGTTLAAATLTYLNVQEWYAARTRRAVAGSEIGTEGQSA